jgi:hypothetical protein
MIGARNDLWVSFSCGTFTCIFCGIDLELCVEQGDRMYKQVEPSVDGVKKLTCDSSIFHVVRATVSAAFEVPLSASQNASQL